MFKGKFEITLNYLEILDTKFHKDLEKMLAFIPKVFKEYCDKYKSVNLENENYRFSLNFFRDSRYNNINSVELECFNKTKEIGLLIAINLFDEEQLKEIPRHQIPVHEDGEEMWEVASFTLLDKYDHSLYEYSFELFNLENGYHLIMLESVADKYDKSILRAVRMEDRILKETDFYNIIHPISFS